MFSNKSFHVPHHYLRRRRRQREKAGSTKINRESFPSFVKNTLPTLLITNDSLSHSVFLFQRGSLDLLTAASRKIVCWQRCFLFITNHVGAVQRGLLSNVATGALTRYLCYPFSGSSVRQGQLDEGRDHGTQ